MNEILVIFVILVTLAVAYLWVYPRFAGKNIRKMQLFDLGFSLIPMAYSAVTYWESDPVFRFLFFDTNWFFFTLLALTVIEFPVLFLYLKAQGLTRAFWSMAFTSGKDASWTGVSAEAVQKNLDDTQWDGLRTPSAKRTLVISANIIFVAGTLFLFFVGDNGWAFYTLIHLLLLSVTLILLRKSVRLVADAPDDLLDERLVKLRDRAYLNAFKVLAGFVLALAGASSALFGLAVGMDAGESSDGFSYTFTITWPQISAFVTFGTIYLLQIPSMALAWAEATFDRPRQTRFGSDNERNV